jgi:3-phenylpropionate/trans-cinnamate dioxygenase ferredoxin component
MSGGRVMMRVALQDELPEGHARVFTAGDIEIALSNVGGEVYAIENVCTHDGGPLGEGRLLDAAIECPRHGARFDVKTGEVLRAPALVPVRSFPVRIVDGVIYVEVEEDEV